ncbi:MAG: hypothetical protein SF052_27670 [Bacteroidia bacterium]|nr:hypothetical protein [Bacteroidia bacterium]
MAGEDIFTLIDAYLSNRLSEEERQAFERRCENDPAFAREVKAHAKAEYAARSYARSQRKETLKNLYRETEKPRAVVRSFRPAAWYGIAAAVIVLLLGLVWLFRPAPSAEELFAQNIGAIEPFTGYRSGESETPDVLEAASEAFNSRNYEAAIPLFEAALADSQATRRAQINLYLGLSHTMLAGGPGAAHHVMAAIAAYDQVPPGSASGQKALWYKALTYVRAGQNEEAKKALEAVVAYPGHYRREAAERLLGG